jgi:hypothetical protein
MVLRSQKGTVASFKMQEEEKKLLLEGDEVGSLLTFNKRAS